MIVKNNFKDVFKKDLFRYYGATRRKYIKKFFRPLEIKYIYYLRKCQFVSCVPLKYYYKLRLRYLSNKTQIQIFPETKIGSGFYIGHHGRIIINPKCILGKNINISTGVVIGQENRGKRKGVPTIKDNCWIGANAVIVGNITIGNDVLIAPLSYVNFDVPDHSIVLGNPGKIISRKNATEEYINNIIN